MPTRKSSCYRAPMKRSRYCWLLLTAWCLLAGAGLAQEPPASLSSIDAFDLWNECEPIRLIVEGLPDDAADIDLTKERIQTLAESRLRAARLYDAAALHDYHSPYLYVRVSVLVYAKIPSGALNIDVSFQRYLFNAAGSSGFAATWEAGSFGMHLGSADYIMVHVSKQIDLFILEYLRVNETACR